MLEKVTYKEPKGYFTPEMLKTAKEWDKAHAKDKAGSTKNKTSKKGK